MILTSDCFSENLTIRFSQLLLNNRNESSVKVLQKIFPIENGDADEKMKTCSP